MGRGVRSRAGHRGGDIVDRHGARGSDDERWNLENPEDDPLQDLRPRDDEPAEPAGDDEYVWPEMTDEYDEDD
jgi:hypothetical protein